MNHQDVSFQSDGVSLHGTLTLCDTEHLPVVVLMLHGSGPLDRNANMPGQELNIFNPIADALRQAGIRSYRYDKRGCARSGGDYYSAGFTDLIIDACAAVDMLISDRGCDKIVLLGHSEGTIIAPVVAHLRPEVAGVIMLCPTVQPVEDTLIRQAKFMARAITEMRGVRGFMARLGVRRKGGLAEEQRKLIAQIKATDAASFRHKRQRIPAKILRELLAHDLREWIAKIQVPVLAISGAKDIQCLPSDAHLISQISQGPAETHCLDDLTHLLRRDDTGVSFNHYNELANKPLDPRVPQLCKSWIFRQYSDE